MKRTILTLVIIFLINSVCNTQELNDWQVGININPFFFTRINSKYFYSKGKQNFPNGFGYGLTIEKNWNTHWGIKTGVESTKQNEKYFVDDTSVDNTKLKMTFEYYKFPITIQYYYALNGKLFLTFNQGIQLSSLKYFKTVIKDISELRIFTSDYSEFIYFQQPENNIYNPDFNGNKLHRDFLYGLIGSIGLKGFLSDKISYSTNLRYEYDIKSADNLPYYSTTPSNTEPEGTTHNLRIGLELGVQYHFSIGNRFNKCPQIL